MTTLPSLNSPERNQPVAIVGGNRIPFARSNRTYAACDNSQLLSAALTGLIERYSLQGEKIDLVVGGAVLKHANEHDLLRTTIQKSPLSSASPAIDIQQACATSLTAAGIIFDAINSGRAQVGISAGSDTTSDPPIAFAPPMSRTLAAINNYQSWKKRLSLLLPLMRNLGITYPQNQDSLTGLSMGEHQALTTLAWNIERKAQDELAYTSHKNLDQAYTENFFTNLITPFHGLVRDDNLRNSLSLETLAAMKPVFGRDQNNPSMTAGNSTPLTDGAATCLLSNNAWAQQRDLTPLAYLIDYEIAALDYIHQDNGLLMAPTIAIAKLLARHKLSLRNFDFYEIHEAFAATVLAQLQALDSTTYCRNTLGLTEKLGEIDRTKLNIKGSSLATGHPFAATGARILATLATIIHHNGGGLGLISLCAAGGQGIAAIVQG